VDGLGHHAHLEARYRAGVVLVAGILWRLADEAEAVEDAVK
jgi:hypothetical protein